MSGELSARVIGDARELSTALRADLRDSTQLAIAVAFAKESVVSALVKEISLLAGIDYALRLFQLYARAFLDNIEAREVSLTSTN